VDWLFFNAGVAEVIALDWPAVIRQFFASPLMLLTLPGYLIERKGSLSPDGIGLVFQANVFGHYYIVRTH
jgi:3-keto steroid reductase